VDAASDQQVPELRGAGKPVRGRLRDLRDQPRAGAGRAGGQASAPQLPSVRIGDDGVRIGVGVLAAAFAPVMGALLTGYFAYDAERNGRAAMRNLMLVLLGFSLVGVFAYARIWGGIFFGI